MKTKNCKKCFTTKDLKQFPRDHVGYKPFCKACSPDYKEPGIIISRIK